MKTERIDSLLVGRGLARSRQQAQELIELELVFVNGKKITKPSQLISRDDKITIHDHPIRNYASRAALKLKGAIEYLKINIRGINALDIGISTGGFSDYLLQNGAQSIVGIDVGHGQLAEKLKSEPRLTCIEGINAREINEEKLTKLGVRAEYELIVVDVSFISLEHILPRCVELLNTNGAIVALVKPQFESGPEALSKSGVIKNTKQYSIVEEKIRDICKSTNLKIEEYFESSIEGSDGNKEFFVYAKKEHR